MNKRSSPYTRNGIIYTDAWSVYVAMTDTGRDIGVVKIGVSTIPLDRILTIHHSCPYPVIAAKWAFVRSKAIAWKIESRIKKAFADKNTRGEWFEFDYSSEADKRRLNDTVSMMFMLEVGAKPDWKSLDTKTMMERSAEKIISARGLANPKQRG